MRNKVRLNIRWKDYGRRIKNNNLYNYEDLIRYRAVEGENICAERDWLQGFLFHGVSKDDIYYLLQNFISSEFTTFLRFR